MNDTTEQLTREAVLAMPAGDEMNRLIGERIYGYRIYHYSKGPGEYWMLVDPDFNPVFYSYGGSDWTNRGERATEVSAWADCPAFSHNYDAAFRLYEHLREIGYSLWIGPGLTPDEWAGQLKPKSENLHEFIAAPDVRLLICRAALLTTL